MQQRLLNVTTQIPDDVARLAHEQQLGSPQERFLITLLRRGWRWPRLFMLILFGLVIVEILALFLAILSSADLFFFFFLLPSLAISYFAFIACSLMVRFTRKLCPIYTCDKGLILKQTPSKFRIVRWDEIESIRYTSARQLRRLFFRGHFYSIRCHDGYTLTFDMSRTLLNSSERFNKAIEDQFTRRRLPFLLADYQAGQTLSFGPLSLDRAGVMLDEKRLSWEQMSDLKLLKGRRLVIYQTGERPVVWLKLAAFKIPNLGLLLALFKRIRSGQSEQEAGFEALAAAYGTTTTLVTNRGRIDPLPDGLAALAEEHGLGERRLDQYLGRSRLINWAGIVVLTVIDALLIGSAAFCGAISLPVLFTDAGGSWLGFFIELAFLCLFLVPYITMNLFHGLQQIHNSLWTFERGLILKYGRQEPIVCRWDEMVAIWRLPSLFWIGYRRQTLFSQSMHGYTFQFHDGSKHTLTRFNINLGALGKIIKEQIVPLQLPAAVAAYQEGQTLSFGQVHLNQQGIVIGTRLLPWSQVRSVGLEANRLVVYDIARRKPWSRLPSARIPNLFLLFALADYAREIRA